MVRDRETKMKESLRIMGLNKHMYSLSFLIQRAIWVTLTCLIICLMTYIMNSGTVTFAQTAKLFAATWLLAVDYLGLSLVVQNFFQDPKLAALCAPFLLFMPTGIALLGIIGPVASMTRGMFVQNNWVQYLFMLPTFPFEVVLSDIFAPNVGYPFFTVDAKWAWAALVLLTPIYYFIHIYLEAVLPDAYGITESCCFCIRKKREVNHREEAELDVLGYSNDDVIKPLLAEKQEA